ncbi:MAG: hypothetical protein ACJ73S_15880 [Mycobacteriales bacterium]
MAIGPVIPGDVPWVFWILAGQAFPQGNEDDMRADAQAHDDFATGVTGILEDLQASATSLHNSVQSDAVENFDAYLQTLETYLGQIRDQATALSQLLKDGALNLEFTKIAINVQVVLSAAEIALAIALAIPSLGASLEAIPIIVAIGQFLIRDLIGRLILSIVMAVLPNLIAQGYQILILHDRASLDGGSLLTSAAAGAVAGLVMFPVEGALNRFAGTALIDMLGQRGARIAISAASAGTANATVNLGMWELNNANDPAANGGKPWWAAVTSGFASGAAMGTLFSAASKAGGSLDLATEGTLPPGVDTVLILGPDQQLDLSLPVTGDLGVNGAPTPAVEPVTTGELSNPDPLPLVSGDTTGPPVTPPSDNGTLIRDVTFNQDGTVTTTFLDNRTGNSVSFTPMDFGSDSPSVGSVGPVGPSGPLDQGGSGGGLPLLPSGGQHPSPAPFVPGGSQVPASPAPVVDAVTPLVPPSTTAGPLPVNLADGGPITEPLPSLQQGWVQPTPPEMPGFAGIKAAPMQFSMLPDTTSAGVHTGPLNVTDAGVPAALPNITVNQPITEVSQAGLPAVTPPVSPVEPNTSPILPELPNTGPLATPVHPGAPASPEAGVVPPAVPVPVPTMPMAAVGTGTGAPPPNVVPIPPEVPTTQPVDVPPPAPGALMTPPAPGQVPGPATNHLPGLTRQAEMPSLPPDVPSYRPGAGPGPALVPAPPPSNPGDGGVTSPVVLPRPGGSPPAPGAAPHLVPGSSPNPASPHGPGTSTPPGVNPGPTPPPPGPRQTPPSPARPGGPRVPAPQPPDPGTPARTTIPTPPAEFPPPLRTHFQNLPSAEIPSGIPNHFPGQLPPEIPAGLPVEWTPPEVLAATPPGSPLPTMPATVHPIEPEPSALPDSAEGEEGRDAEEPAAAEDGEEVAEAAMTPALKGALARYNATLEAATEAQTEAVDEAAAAYTKATAAAEEEHTAAIAEAEEKRLREFDRITLTLAPTGMPATELVKLYDAAERARAEAEQAAVRNRHRAVTKAAKELDAAKRAARQAYDETMANAEQELKRAILDGIEDALSSPPGPANLTPEQLDQVRQRLGGAYPALERAVARAREQEPALAEIPTEELAALYHLAGDADGLAALLHPERQTDPADRLVAEAARAAAAQLPGRRAVVVHHLDLTPEETAALTVGALTTLPAEARPAGAGPESRSGRGNVRVVHDTRVTDLGLLGGESRLFLAGGEVRVLGVETRDGTTVVHVSDDPSVVSDVPAFVQRPREPVDMSTPGFRASERDRLDFLKYLWRFDREAARGSVSRSLRLYTSRWNKLAETRSARPELANVPAPDLIALMYYTHTSSQVNAPLWSGDPALAGARQAVLRVTLSALHQLPETGGTVFRGTALTATDLAAYEPGAVVEWKGVTSTTAWKDRAVVWSLTTDKERTRVVFSVLTERARSMAHVGIMGDPAEFLLVPGTRVQVVDRTVHDGVVHVTVQDVTGTPGARGEPAAFHAVDEHGLHLLAGNPDAAPFLAGVQEHEGVWYLLGHATEHGFVHNGQVVHPGDVRAALEAAGWQQGRPVRLVGCDLAAGDYARAVADTLGSPVIVASGTVFLYQRDGQVHVTAATVDKVTGLPTTLDPGEWRVVYPTGWQGSELDPDLVTPPRPEAAGGTYYALGPGQPSSSKASIHWPGGRQPGDRHVVYARFSRRTGEFQKWGIADVVTDLNNRYHGKHTFKPSMVPGSWGPPDAKGEVTVEIEMVVIKAFPTKVEAEAVEHFMTLNWWGDFNRENWLDKELAKKPAGRNTPRTDSQFWNTVTRSLLGTYDTAVPWNDQPAGADPHFQRTIQDVIAAARRKMDAITLQAYTEYLPYLRSQRPGNPTRRRQLQDNINLLNQAIARRNATPAAPPQGGQSTQPAPEPPEEPSGGVQAPPPGGRGNATRPLSLRELGIENEPDLVTPDPVPKGTGTRSQEDPALTLWRWQLDGFHLTDRTREVPRGGDGEIRLAPDEWLFMIETMYELMKSGTGHEYAWLFHPDEGPHGTLELVEGSAHRVRLPKGAFVLIHSHPWGVAGTENASGGDYQHVRRSRYSHTYLMEHSFEDGGVRAQILIVRRDGSAPSPVLPGEVTNPLLAPSVTDLVGRGAGAPELGLFGPAGEAIAEDAIRYLRWLLDGTPLPYHLDLDFQNTETAADAAQHDRIVADVRRLLWALLDRFPDDPFATVAADLLGWWPDVRDTLDMLFGGEQLDFDQNLLATETLDALEAWQARIAEVREGGDIPPASAPAEPLPSPEEPVSPESPEAPDGPSLGNPPRHGGHRTGVTRPLSLELLGIHGERNLVSGPIPLPRPSHGHRRRRDPEVLQVDEFDIIAGTRRVPRATGGEILFAPDEWAFMVDEIYKRMRQPDRAEHAWLFYPDQGPYGTLALVELDEDTADLPEGAVPLIHSHRWGQAGTQSASPPDYQAVRRSRYTHLYVVTHSFQDARLRAPVLLIPRDGSGPEPKLVSELTNPRLLPSHDDLVTRGADGEELELFGPAGEAVAEDAVRYLRWLIYHDGPLPYHLELGREHPFQRDWIASDVRRMLAALAERFPGDPLAGTARNLVARWQELWDSIRVLFADQRPAGQGTNVAAQAVAGKALTALEAWQARVAAVTAGAPLREPPDPIVDRPIPGWERLGAGPAPTGDIRPAPNFEDPDNMYIRYLGQVVPNTYVNPETGESVRVTRLEHMPRWAWDQVREHLRFLTTATGDEVSVTDFNLVRPGTDVRFVQGGNTRINTSMPALLHQHPPNHPHAALASTGDFNNQSHGPYLWAYADHHTGDDPDEPWQTTRYQHDHEQTLVTEDDVAVPPYRAGYAGDPELAGWQQRYYLRAGQAAQEALAWVSQAVWSLSAWPDVPGRHHVMQQMMYILDGWPDSRGAGTYPGDLTDLRRVLTHLDRDAFDPNDTQVMWDLASYLPGVIQELERLRQDARREVITRRPTQPLSPVPPPPPPAPPPAQQVRRGLRWPRRLRWWRHDPQLSGGGPDDAAPGTRPDPPPGDFTAWGDRAEAIRRTVPPPELLPAGLRGLLEANAGVRGRHKVEDDLRRWLEDTLAFEHAGVTARVTDVTLWRDQLWLTHRFFNAQGDEVGKAFLGVGIEPVPGEPADRLIALGFGNFGIALDSQYQRHGVGTAFVRAMEDFWIGQGVTEVHGDAGLERGGYVWAREGYDFGSAGELDEIVATIQRAADEGRLSPEALEDWENLTANAPDYPPGRVRGYDEPVVRSEDPKQADVTALEISRLGWRQHKDTWDGKELLSGTKWRAIKHLLPSEQDPRVFRRPTQLLPPAPPSPFAPWGSRAAAIEATLPPPGVLDGGLRSLLESDDPIPPEVQE